jgi:hypothetical protein
MTKLWDFYPLRNVLLQTGMPELFPVKVDGLEEVGRVQFGQVVLLDVVVVRIRLANMHANVGQFILFSFHFS